MLEPTPAPDADPFNRPVPDQPDAVDDNNLYEVERLLDKRVTRRGRGFSTQYLVRWRGYGPEFDQWYRVQDLEGCNELIEEYEARIHNRIATN